MKKKQKKRPKAASCTDPNRYPKGWNHKRVKALADYYDNQSDKEAIAEIDAALRDNSFALMQIPIELVPEVKKLLAKRAG